MLTLYLPLLDEDEDRARFLRLHAAYEMKLYWMAMGYFHNEKMAEEAVQQTWLNLLKHFEKIKAVSWDKTEGYVVIILKHACLDMLKREKKYTPLSEDWDPPAAQTGEPLDAFGRLVALIRSLPESYRTVLELKFVLEWSNRDIAKALGRKESTVATQIKRGRELLLERMREEGYDVGT